MATMTSAANLGPLTTTYSPSGANCNTIFQTNPGKILLYGTTDAKTSSCFPTSFNANGNFYYSPGVCPSGYDYACTAGLGDGGTAATCCPSGYVCRKGRVATDTGACQSTLLTDSSFTIMAYTSNTTSTLITDFYAAGNSVYAKGIVIRRASDDPAWAVSDSTTSVSTSATKSGSTSTATSGTTATQTSSSSSSSSSSQGPSGTDTSSGANSGLSSGAKAGIGIAVAFGVLLIIGIAVAAFLIGKRKRRAAAAAVAADNAQNYPTQEYSPDAYTDQPTEHPGELGPGGNKGDYSALKPVELEERGWISELDAHTGPHKPVELTGN